MRTRGRKDRPVFWLGVPLLLDRSRLKKKGKKKVSGRSPAPAKPSIEVTRAKMQGLLDTGEVASRAELARHLQVSRAYVTQVLGPMVHAVHALEGEAPRERPQRHMEVTHETPWLVSARQGGGRLGRRERREPS